MELLTPLQRRLLCEIGQSPLCSNMPKCVTWGTREWGVKVKKSSRSGRSHCRQGKAGHRPHPFLALQPEAIAVCLHQRPGDGNP